MRNRILRARKFLDPSCTKSWPWSYLYPHAPLFCYSYCKRRQRKLPIVVQHQLLAPHVWQLFYRPLWRTCHGIVAARGNVLNGRQWHSQDKRVTWALHGHMLQLRLQLRQLKIYAKHGKILG